MGFFLCATLYIKKVSPCPTAHPSPGNAWDLYVRDATQRSSNLPGKNCKN